MKIYFYLVNGIVQALRLRSYGIRVSPRLIRALSRVYINAIIKPESGIIKRYTRILLVVTYLLDRSLYIIPDLASIGLLWHVRDIRDYEYLVKFKPRSIIIDIGAHIGLFTTHVYRNLKCDCFCIAYEPHPLNYALLRLNTRLNNVSKCLIKPYALSLRKGKTKLYIHEESGGHSTHVQSSRLIIVRTTSLDHEIKHELSQILINLTSVKKHNIYVKIDVEGAEVDVLKGSMRFIRILKPYIVLEADRANILKILSMLKSNNYLLFITPFGSGKVHIHAIPAR